MAGDLRISSITMTTKVGGRVARQETALETVPLLVTLTHIMNKSNEAHTKANIQKVMDMIRDARTTI